MAYFNLIFSPLLALLVLVSSSGIEIHKHYCGSVLESVSILTSKRSCCEDSANMPAECCHNETEFIKTEISADLLVASHEQNAQPTRLEFIISSELDPVKYSHLRVSRSHRKYKPPLPDADILVRVQSFLI